MTAIHEFVHEQATFETHDHQPGYSAHDWSAVSFREFDGYARADLAVAMGPAFSEEQLDDTNAFFRVWPHVRTTGYGRAIELGIAQLCGMELTRDTADAVTQWLRDFTSERSAAEVYRACFEAANIVGAVNDILPSSELTTARMEGSEYPDFFRFAPRLDMVLAIDSADTVRQIESFLDCSIASLGELEQAMEQLVSNAMAGGRVAALKIGVAYKRTLDFGEVPRQTASTVFDNLMRGNATDLKPLQDYCFHRYLRCALDHDLPVQIHTGYLAGLNSDIRQGDPSPLVPIFMKYPDLRFDLFHASWPYSEFIGAVGKEFPNVWLDLCWAWAMNPVQMERILDEWLAAVPNNKILGYGSDTTTPFAVVGYAQQAREGIAAVLERKIARGEYDEAAARHVATRIMHDNAAELLGASPPGKG